MNLRRVEMMINHLFRCDYWCSSHDSILLILSTIKLDIPSALTYTVNRVIFYMCLIKRSVRFLPIYLILSSYFIGREKIFPFAVQYASIVLICGK